MNLPTLRLTYFRTWPGWEAVSHGLHRQLRGRVLWLPAAMKHAELEELVDALVVLLGLPVHVTQEPRWWRSANGQGAILVVPTPVRKAPEPVAESVVLCLRAQEPGNWSLELPHEVLHVRDAVMECIGRQLSQEGLSRIVGWAAGVADTPATVLRFVDGAQACLVANPRADDATLYCAGLAATVGWLLAGVESRVAQWALTLALPGPAPEQRIGTDAAILGKAEALRRAFDCGLVYQIPEREGGVLDWRRPLEALGRLSEAPGKPELAKLASDLEKRLEPGAREVLKRAARPAVHGLGLPGPTTGIRLVGREELVQRLVALLEPAERIQTCVLHGSAGSGRTAVAATVAQRLAHRLETVWISFAGSPMAGWARVAAALGVETRSPHADTPDAAGVPRWVRETHGRLAAGEYLLVVDDVDAVEEEQLPRWLPAGPGRCAVLATSRFSQRALQRQHDAVALSVPALTDDEARRLLEGPGPQVAQEAPAKALQKLFDSLLEDERKVLRSAWVCSPAGSRLELVGAISGVAEAASVMGQLVEKGWLVRTGEMVRLDALVRFYLDEQAKAGFNTAPAYWVSHAEVTGSLADMAIWQKNHILQAGLYQDVLLASARSGELVRREGSGVAGVCCKLADCLETISAGNHRANVEQAIMVYRGLLEVWTREGFPRDWAQVHYRLGVALINLPTASRAKNLEQAMESFKRSLEVWTREGFPEEWARLHDNLGIALWSLPTGNRGENLMRAIECFERAQEVLVREKFPREWANIQNNLGTALVNLPIGDRAANLKRAMVAYERALEVWTRETSPRLWAGVQNNLGTMLHEFEDTGSLERAMEFYERALEVWTREAFPSEWAMAQCNMGRALYALQVGNRDENLQRALKAFNLALEIWTREEFPEYWARVQNNLGLALAALPSGNREENLRRAIEAHERALEVFTREEFPESWTRTMLNLENAQAALRELKKGP